MMRKQFNQVKNFFKKISGWKTKREMLKSKGLAAARSRQDGFADAYEILRMIGRKPDPLYET